jgi:hypothetical protein
MRYTTGSVGRGHPYGRTAAGIPHTSSVHLFFWRRIPSSIRNSAGHPTGRYGQLEASHRCFKDDVPSTSWSKCSSHQHAVLFLSLWLRYRRTSLAGIVYDVPTSRNFRLHEETLMLSAGSVWLFISARTYLNGMVDAMLESHVVLRA